MDSAPLSEHEEPESGDLTRSTSGKTLAAALLAAAVAAIALFAILSGGEQADPEAPEIANLTFLTDSGDDSSLAAFEGELLVVNFFASWCAPCRAELPEFEEVAQANAGQVRFIGVNHDLDEATWRAFVSETDITYDTVFQPNAEIWTTLDAKGMPSTAFVTTEGDVVHLWTGVLNAELLQDKIDEHLLENA